MFPRKLLLLIIDFLFKNKATVLAPAGSPISNTKIIDACGHEVMRTSRSQPAQLVHIRLILVIISGSVNSQGCWPPQAILWGRMAF